ncbi:MAG: DUF4136 domain-containing protein [Halioglobus sp.]|nr:DUF4136 domain-containing protein [Halioglobus sp.]
MRSTLIFAFTILSLVLVACSGVEIQQSGIDKFRAGDYRYYTWRTEPLPSSTRSSDPVYTIDPVIRREVDADLQRKGYVLDKSRAQFTVDYLYVSGMQQGARSELASNITPYPRVTPNRQVSQATVDNAIALGGVKETNNIILQFNDLASNQEVWQATLTKVVEDANNIDASRIDQNLQDYLARALKNLPPAGQ